MEVGDYCTSDDGVLWEVLAVWNDESEAPARYAGAEEFPFVRLKAHRAPSVVSNGIVEMTEPLERVRTRYSALDRKTGQDIKEGIAAAWARVNGSY